MVSTGTRFKTEACRADVLSHQPPSTPAPERSLLFSASAFAFISNKDISIVLVLGNFILLVPYLKVLTIGKIEKNWENWEN